MTSHSKKDMLFFILLIAISPKDDDDRDEVGVVDGSADGERRRYFSKVKSFSFTGFKMTSNAVLYAFKFETSSSVVYQFVFLIPLFFLNLSRALALSRLSLSLVSLFSLSLSLFFPSDSLLCSLSQSLPLFVAILLLA